MRVLLVEDEAGLATVLRDRLQSEGYSVVIARTGPDGETLATEGSFSIVLLDLMLPGRSGLDVCRNLRNAGVTTPILMLTAKGDLVDKVMGLRTGADDYLTKPFDMAELLARIEALLRRTHVPIDVPIVTFGEIAIHSTEGAVFRNEQLVDLSTREYALLVYLVRNAGRVLTRDRLLTDVWNYDTPPSSRTVDVHISWLRQKLERDPRHPQHIRTAHGQGYKFVL